MQPVPGGLFHAPLHPCGHRDEHQDVERERAQADGQRAVRREEGNEHVDGRDARGVVEQQRDDMQRPERDPEHRRVLVQRAQRAVAAEPVEHRGPQRDAGKKRDRQRRVGREPAHAGEQPHELIGGHAARPEMSTVFARTSASSAVSATTDTSSTRVVAGRPVRGSMRWCRSPHRRLRVLLVAAPRFLSR